MTTPGSSARLFHAIVVMGAALGASACGGRSESDSSGTDAGNGGSSGVGGVGGVGGALDAGGPDPSDCDLPAQFKCESYFPHVNCQCDTTAIAQPSNCEHSSQFVCEWCSCPPGGICLCSPYLAASSILTCKCDPNKPSGPDACASTAEFFCNQWGPPWSDCYCFKGVPASAADCPGTGQWTCHSYSPPIGCKCFSIITK
ncbi:MAG: hypothetical protein IPI67_33690 [Myxococcales bacterium]|nr:hypothetical protein [Myxococcales bacterium]